MMRRVAHYVRLAIAGRPPPPALPVFHDQPLAIRRRDVAQGLVHLSLFCMVCMVYHVALLTAERVSVAIAALVLLSLVHAVYLCIYGMEACGVLSAAYSSELVSRVEEMGFFGNYFAPNPTVWRLPQRLWEGLAVNPFA